MRSFVACALFIVLAVPTAAHAQGALTAPPPAPPLAPPPAPPVAPPAAVAPAAPVAPGPQVAPPAPAAPAAPGQDSASSSSDSDSATGSTAPGQAGKEPPFYRPSGAELALAPPPAGYPFMFSLMQDTHLFVDGSIRGFGSETRARFGGDFGFTIGTYNFNTLGAGIDAFQFRGIKLVSRAPEGLPFDIYMLLPNLDVRAYGLAGRWGAAIGTSVSGIRIANCAITGCFEASLRLITVDLWGAGDFVNASAAVSIGGGLTAGIKL